MTPLMMLALTLPPSLAFVIERWMSGREAQARKLADEQVAIVDAWVGTASANSNAIARHEADLQRLNEQLTTLSERVYR